MHVLMVCLSICAGFLLSSLWRIVCQRFFFSGASVLGYSCLFLSITSVFCVTRLLHQVQRKKSNTEILSLTSWVQMKHSCFTIIDVNLSILSPSPLTLSPLSFPPHTPLRFQCLHHLLHTSLSQCLLLSSASIHNIKCRMFMTPTCSVLPLWL